MITGLELVPGRALADALELPPSFIKARGFVIFLFAALAPRPWPRRGHLQILAEILEIVSRQGATKTSIVYKTNINFTLANKYIDYLESRKLIQRSSGDSVRLFTLTPKGREALLQLRKTMDEVLEGGAILT